MNVMQEVPKKLDVENPQDEINNSELPVLVDCFASWCGPCRMLSPIIEGIAEKYAGEINVIKVDVDKHSQFSDDYGIRSIPTLLFFLKGNLVKTEVGYKSESKLSEIIEKTLFSSSDEIENDINNSKGALIVDFYKNQDSECQKLTQKIDDLKQQYGDDLKVIKVNVERYKELSEKYNVTVCPTLKFFRDGELVHSTVGDQNTDTISNIVNNKLFVKKNS